MIDAYSIDAMMKSCSCVQAFKRIHTKKDGNRRGCVQKYDFYQKNGTMYRVEGQLLVPNEVLNGVLRN